MTATPDRLKRGAEYYASIGWKVFATAGIVDGRCDCGRPTHDSPKDFAKHPRQGTHGDKDATTDLDIVQGWWEAYPNSNIGVPCLANGFIVVDIDPRNGGEESASILESRIGGFPETVEACTGEYTMRGRTVRGRHLYYKAPQGAYYKELKGLKGIDFKAPGYVLAAPSNHGSGVTYDWIPGRAPWEIPMAEAPEELLQEILKKRGGGGGSGGGVTYGTREWNGEKLDIDAILADGIHEGERDNKVHQIACSLANDYDPSKSHMVASFKALIRGINAKHVFPPLPDDDIDRICRQAIKLVEENPKSEMLWPGIEEYKATVAAWSPSAPPAGAPPATTAAAAGGPPSGSVAAVPTGTAGTAGIAPLGDVDRALLPKDRDALSAENGGVPGDRTMTDMGNARRLVDNAGSRLRYTAGLGWHVWNGEYWVPDSGELQVQEIAKELPIWIAAETTKTSDRDKQDQLLKWSLRARSRAARETAVKDARSDARIVVPVSKWDANPHLLGVKNGVINLRTGALTTDARELYITKQVQVAYSPGMSNPRWAQFLEFATGGDKELQRYLQLAAGYTLTGDRHHECLFLVYGPPGSGKSTFLDVLGTLLGSYRITFAADVLQDTGMGARGSQEYYMAKLMGKRMLAISELPESVNVQEDAIKRLTGDQEISGRNPGGEPFEFLAQAKLWIGTNHRPRIRDQAMWRRIRAIPFLHVPEKPDPDLKPYLLDPNGALPAALSWAVDGAMMLLGSTDRQPLKANASTAVKEATEEYQASENRIGIFLDEETVRAPGAAIGAQELWTIYQQWSDDRGEKPMTYIAFGRKLQEQGEKVAGIGRAMVVADRRVTPRSVPATSVPADWGGLVDRSR